MGPPIVQEAGYSAPLAPNHHDLKQPQVGPSVSPAPAASTSPVLLVKVLCRVLTLAMTLISLIVLTTNQPAPDLKFNDVHAYRYMLFVILLAFVYSLLQTALTVVQLTSANPVNNNLAFLDFYGDIVILYSLATGAAAGFGATLDLQRFFSGEVMRLFFEKGNVTASLLFLSSACSVVTLVLSR